MIRMDVIKEAWQPIFIDWRYYYYFNSVKQLIDRIKLVKMHYNRKMRIALDIQKLDEG